MRKNAPYYSRSRLRRPAQRKALTPAAVLARAGAPGHWPTGPCVTLPRAAGGGAGRFSARFWSRPGLEDSALGVMKAAQADGEASASWCPRRGSAGAPRWVELCWRGWLAAGGPARPRRAAGAGGHGPRRGPRPSAAPSTQIDGGGNGGWQVSMAYLLPRPASPCSTAPVSSSPLPPSQPSGTQLLGQDIPYRAAGPGGWGPRGGRTCGWPNSKAGGTTSSASCAGRSQRRAAASPAEAAHGRPPPGAAAPALRPRRPRRLNLQPDEETVSEPSEGARTGACLRLDLPLLMPGRHLLAGAGPVAAPEQPILIVNHACSRPTWRPAAGAPAHCAGDEQGATSRRTKPTQQFGFQTSESDIAPPPGPWLHQRIGVTRGGGLARASSNRPRRHRAPGTGCRRLAGGLPGGGRGPSAPAAPAGLFGLSPTACAPGPPEGDYHDSVSPQRGHARPARLVGVVRLEEPGPGPPAGQVAPAGRARPEGRARGLWATKGAGGGGRRPPRARNRCGGDRRRHRARGPATDSWLSLSRWSGATRSTGDSGGGAGRIGLASTPLQVADALRAGLFDDKESVVPQQRHPQHRGALPVLRLGAWGLESPGHLLVGSPFDYARSTLVLVPQDMPEPGAAGYQPALGRFWTSVAPAKAGHWFSSSYARSCAPLTPPSEHPWRRRASWCWPTASTGRRGSSSRSSASPRTILHQG